MAASQPRFSPDSGASGTGPQSFPSCSAGVAAVRTPNCEVWVGGYTRKLPALMLRKSAADLVLGIFGRAFAVRYRVLARDMQTGHIAVFDEPAASKKHLAENRA